MPNTLWLSAVFLLPVIAAIFLYQLDTFDPAPYPNHEMPTPNQPPLFVPRRNSRMLQGSERIGEGQLPAPEDLAFDLETGVIYTGSEDGWISRVKLNESVVEKWVNTGGRPLGIVHGIHGEVIVADADKGLLNISKEGIIKLLTDEAEGLKFKLTDGVDIGHDGLVYFTDASHKYNLKEHILDLLEGRPYGRLMSYDPSTQKTQVLVRDLYFANGVAVSADQTYVIFCETPMRRCKKYYIQGARKGFLDMFIENLPGLPDNIRYDGEGQYWIALAMVKCEDTIYVNFNSSEMHNTRVLFLLPKDPPVLYYQGIYPWDLIRKYAFIRKVSGILLRYIAMPRLERNGGVIAVDLDGKPTAHYYDPSLFLSSSGIKIGEHLYCGSIVLPYIIRLNVSRYPATEIA